MFANPIAALSDGGANHDLSLMGVGDRKSSYKDLTSAQDTTLSFDISHSESGKGENLIRRSLYRIDQAVVDPDGNNGTISVYLVVQNPLHVCVAADVTKVVTLMKSFLSASGVIAKVVAAEI